VSLELIRILEQTSLDIYDRFVIGKKLRNKKLFLTKKKKRKKKPQKTQTKNLKSFSANP
jgi:hypothetical protein